MLPCAVFSIEFDLGAEPQRDIAVAQLVHELVDQFACR